MIHKLQVLDLIDDAVMELVHQERTLIENALMSGTLTQEQMVEHFRESLKNYIGDVG